MLPRMTQLLSSRAGIWSRGSVSQPMLFNQYALLALKLPWNKLTLPLCQAWSIELSVVREKPQGQTGFMYQNLVFSESQVQTCSFI